MSTRTALVLHTFDSGVSNSSQLASNLAYICNSHDIFTSDNRLTPSPQPSSHIVASVAEEYFEITPIYGVQATAAPAILRTVLTFDGTASSLEDCVAHVGVNTHSLSQIVINILEWLIKKRKTIGNDLTRFQVCGCAAVV